MVFSPFKADTDYFAADKQAMINLRVTRSRRTARQAARRGHRDRARGGNGRRRPLRPGPRSRGQPDRAVGTAGGGLRRETMRYALIYGAIAGAITIAVITASIAVDIAQPPPVGVVRLPRHAGGAVADLRRREALSRRRMRRRDPLRPRPRRSGSASRWSRAWSTSPAGRPTSPPPTAISWPTTRASMHRRHAARRGERSRDRGDARRKWPAIEIVPHSRCCGMLFDLQRDLPGRLAGGAGLGGGAAQSAGAAGAADVVDDRRSDDNPTLGNLRRHSGVDCRLVVNG